jgi:hypothetical protein
LHQLQRMRWGFPFSIRQLHEMSTATSAHKTLSRLTQKGIIVRVAKGICVRPKAFASMLSIEITASADQIAKKWAQQNGYILLRQGIESAYRLGLQTQAPVRTVFWSNGASSTFSVGNDIVEVRHVAESKLRWKSRPEGELLRSFTVTPANCVKLSELKKALTRLKLSEAQSRVAIKKLKAAPLPGG